MKCFNCEKEFEKPKYGRNIFVELLLFLFFIPGLIVYYMIKPRWACPYCGNKVIKTKFNK